MADLEWAGARNLTVGHVNQLVDEIAITIRSIDQSLLDAHEPEAGAYAFFNHSSHFLTRTEDVGLVIRRLLARREELSEADRAEGDLMMAGVEPHAPRHQRALTQAADLSRDMRLDMESLYLFGALAVDQFAHLALRLGGLPQKAANTGPGNAFTLLAKWLENGRYGELQPLWQAVGRELVWVRWQVWFYRNQLVVHADRPWQRGSDHGHTTNDFSLFIPRPLGGTITQPSSRTLLQSGVRSKTSSAMIGSRRQRHPGSCSTQCSSGSTRYLDRPRGAPSVTFTHRWAV